MKTLLPLLILISNSAFAKRGCLSQHIENAVTLNQSRLPIYSALSSGKSEAVSKKLIHKENLIHLLLPFTTIENENPELLCEVFKTTPNPGTLEIQRDKPSLSEFNKIDWKSFSSDIKELIKDGNISMIHQKIISQIESLEAEPRFNCMSRHMLESMARVAQLGPQGPDFSLHLLKLETMAQKFATELDEMAAPLQAQGIPIFCHDLPLIQYK